MSNIDIIVNAATGETEIWFDYAASYNAYYDDVLLPGVFVNIYNTGSGGNHIRNIEVVKQENIAAHDSGQLFNPAWIDHIKDMRELRFMDWMKTNLEMGGIPYGAAFVPQDELSWADRPQVSDFSWTKCGAPVEVMVELANRTHADPWFNIPSMANDVYIEHFVQYMHDKLAPGLKAHFEYSNEVWNGQFEAHHYADYMASDLWPTSTRGFEQFYALRSVQMSQIIEEVYGTELANRAVRIISSQTLGVDPNQPVGSNTYLAGVILAVEDIQGFLGPNRNVESYFDAFAITGYFDGGLGRYGDQWSAGNAGQMKPG